MSEHITYLINVDMDLFSNESLKKIADEIANKVSILHEGEYSEGGYFLRAELIKSVKNANDAINEFVEIITEISNQDLLGACRRKEFNIGIEAGTEPAALEFSVSNEVMKKAAAVGFQIAFTVYAYNKKRWPA